MKCHEESEADMMIAVTACAQSPEDLLEYIDSLINREHSYGTQIYAASMAAYATYLYVSQQVNLSGLQKSLADLDFIRRTRGLTSPFIILQAALLLESPDGIEQMIEKQLPEWLKWAAKAARLRLAGYREAAIDPKLWEHWKRLAAYDEQEKPND